MPLYDVRCNNGHRYEVLRPAGTQTDVCECGQLAIRVYGYKAAVIHEPVADTRNMFRRYQEGLSEMPEGSGGVLWQKAKARVKQMRDAGEAPPVRKDW